MSDLAKTSLLACAPAAMTGLKPTTPRSHRGSSTPVCAGCSASSRSVMPLQPRTMRLLLEGMTGYRFMLNRLEESRR